MRSRILRALLVCAAIGGFLFDNPHSAGAVSSGVVISQVYGGGGNSGATYTNDFIELFNRGTAPVNLAGMSVQYASATGTSWQVTALTGVTLAPGQYYLVQEAAGAGGTTALPAPDAAGSIPMSASAGKVALVNGTAALSGTTGCPSPATVVDFVGFGSTANCTEGSGTFSNLANTTAAIRAGQGCTDTDSNVGDFSIGAPAPRNTAAALHVCSVSSTNPSGTLAADRSSYAPTDPITLTVAVTPGANPASTGIGVTANLSTLALGTAVFHDDGAGGDVAAGDNTFTFASTIPAVVSGGVKTVTAVITDAQARSVNTNSIQVTVQTAAAPTGTGSASPASIYAGGSTTLAVTVTPGTNPPSTNLSVTADLSSIVPGDFAHALQAGADNSFTLSATVDPSTTAGAKSLPITVADGEGRSSGFTIPLTVTAPLASSTIVISQLYGGGGNTGSTYLNDYVQLYNRGGTTVDLAGWTIQYASATGTSWANKQPLGGLIAPGEYYLIALGTGTVGDGAALPPANVSGEINMSATSGKLALVDNGDTLATDKCPTGTHVRDFVGYGSSANCSEGSAAPGASNTSALFRQGGGFIDSNNNADDFVAAPPLPTVTAPIMEIGPAVLSTDPVGNATAAPRDATIDVTFTEPVDVFGVWYDITCSQTGPHNDATTAVAHNGKDHYVTPNANFLPGETCTVTIFQNQVSDQDLDDSAANTDHLPADYSWTFTVAAPLPNSFQPPYGPEVHLTMGNPSGAVADVNRPDDYLMMKPEYALSYNRDLGRPNWVSWHLSPEWFGSLSRVDTFRADPQVPADWYRVQSFSFESSGFDRGHMTPNADRDLETSIPINQATYLMSNMIAQAPDNNQGPWAHLENYLRAQLGTSHASPLAEAYVVSGPAGIGGIGDNGYRETIDNGHVTVPAYTWKVALILPFSTGDDVSRVTCEARTIAVIMPNVDHIGTGASDDWMPYLTTVDAVEALTGYDLFSNVPPTIQNCIQAGVNGQNPKSQVISFAPIATHHFGDADFPVTVTSSSNLPVTLEVVSGPAAIVNGLVHITGTGAVIIRATQPGNVDPDPAAIGNTFARAVPVEQTFAVDRGTPVFTSLAAPAIEAGTAATLVSGVVSLNGIAPAGEVTIAAGGATTTASIRPDGTFSGSLATASLDAGQSPYTITFTFAGDANFTSATATSTLTVGDTTAPAIGPVTASPDVLGAPSHKMTPITVSYTASDLSGAPVCALSVSSNEAVNGTGDGNTAADWLIGDAHHLQLRAERAGTGLGRIYTITATCTDRFGNAASRSTTVAVSK